MKPFRFIHLRHGPAVFLFLGFASFLTGGGVAQIVPFSSTWAVGTRIRASLAIWRRLLPPEAHPALSRIWPWTITASTGLFLVALEIAVFGYVPGVSDQPELLHICWKILGVALGLYFVSVCSGFAQDVDTRPPIIA